MIMKKEAECSASFFVDIVCNISKKISLLNKSVVKGKTMVAFGDQIEYS